MKKNLGLRIFGASLVLFSVSAYWAMSTKAASLSGGICVVCTSSGGAGGPATVVSAAPLMGDGSAGNPITIDPTEPITTSSLTATDSMLVRADALSVGPTGLIGMGTTNPAFGVHISSRLVLLDGVGNNIFLNQGSIGVQLDGSITGSITIRRSDSSSAASTSNLFLVRRRGTQAAPTPVIAGDQLGLIAFRGYGTGEATGGVIRGEATSTWSGTDRGTRISFLTTPTGSTVLTQAVMIDNQQFVGIGTSVPASKLHIASGAIIANGTGAFITSNSSMNASGFFGNGAGITGVTAAINANLTGPVTSIGNATTIVGPVPAAAVDLSTVTAALALKADLSGANFTGNVFLSTVTLTVKNSSLIAQGEGGPGGRLDLQNTFSSASTSPNIRFIKRRGSDTTPTAVLNDDRLGRVDTLGYDGTTTQLGSSIETYATENWSNPSNHAAKISFKASNSTDLITIAEMTPTSMTVSGSLAVASSMTASFINVAGATNVASIVAMSSAAANVAINTLTGVHFSTATATLRGGRYTELSATVVIDNQAGGSRIYTMQFFEDGVAVGLGHAQTVLAGDDYLGTAVLPFNAGRASGSHSYSLRIISSSVTGTQLLANGNVVIKEY